MSIKVDKTFDISRLKISPGRMKGLVQSIDDNLLDWSYSSDCRNVDVSDGDLSVRKGISRKISAICSIEDGTYGTPVYVCKLMRLNGIVNGPKPISTEEGITIVGAYYSSIVHGDIFYWYAYYRTTTSTAAAWHKIYKADGTTPAMTSIDPKYANFVEYLIDTEHCLVVMGGGTPYKLYLEAAGAPTTYAIKADEITDAPSNAIFAALHKDRVWAAGNLSGVAGAYVDGINTVYYSNAYDAEDWTTAGETGEIVIETFDGDYIRGMANLLDDVLIFKKNTIWRVDGDTPDEYEIVQVYASQGIAAFNAICSDGSNCFIAGDDGIYQYTGTDLEPILTREIMDIYDNMTNVQLTIFNNKLYVWSRTRNEVFWNSTGIVYDIKTSIINAFNFLSSSIKIRDAFIMDNEVVFLVNDGYIYKIDEDTLKDYTSDIDAYWYFPQSDCNYPNAIKTLVGIYFTGYGSTNAGASGAQIKLTVYFTKANGTLKNKEKTVTLQTSKKIHELRFFAMGRIFKIKVENVDGSIFHLSNFRFVFELAED